MFENISLEGLIIMGEVVISTLAALCMYLAFVLYRIPPEPKRKPGRPRKK